MTKGLDNFREEADDLKGDAPGLEDGLGALLDEERSCSKDAVIKANEAVNQVLRVLGKVRRTRQDKTQSRKREKSN